MTDLERALMDAEADFPIGRRVRYYPVSGYSEHVESAIRSKPWALGHGAIVIAIEGKAGGVYITHLEVI
ncbi:hypothetical protein [Ruixingdingia sedimenti]|uniref:Uncharacterized protein n=1 Tax=Ruixingdingia sedimenti TaxID=3073604 RepID=A0ABU1FEE2_9RHOB|nr:hypothetical protein [Xinfangfangia sp. LG-4]MDR5655229.1 hypothetical protein [Xinfangfangia sp. LG-4]